MESGHLHVHVLAFLERTGNCICATYISRMIGGCRLALTRWGGYLRVIRGSYIKLCKLRCVNKRHAGDTIDSAILIDLWLEQCIIYSP